MARSSNEECACDQHNSTPLPVPLNASSSEQQYTLSSSQWSKWHFGTRVAYQSHSQAIRNMSFQDWWTVSCTSKHVCLCMFFQLIAFVLFFSRTVHATICFTRFLFSQFCFLHMCGLVLCNVLYFSYVCASSNHVLHCLSDVCAIHAFN